MKKWLCIPCGGDDTPNVDVTLNCMSACCESRNTKRERTYTKANTTPKKEDNDRRTSTDILRPES